MKHFQLINMLIWRSMKNLMIILWEADCNFLPKIIHRHFEKKVHMFLEEFEIPIAPTLKYTF